MLYRKLADTDLNLSVVGMGSWALGGRNWGAPADDRTSTKAIHAALDVGINWFDTAPLYGNGHADEVLRNALKGRKEALIATKVGVRQPGASGHAESQLDARHLREDLEASLARLKRDTIDLLQVHWPCEHSSPLAETFTTLQALKREGKVRHIGVCNYGPGDLSELTRYAEVVSLQTPYSLLRRELEGSLLPVCKERGLGILAYEPLCRGLLTGKFLTQPTFPDTDLRARDGRFKGDSFTHAQGLTHDLGKLARRLGISTAAVALGWVVAQPFVTSAIAGAKTPAQVIENAQAHRLVDAPEVVTIIEKILHRHRHTRPT